MLITIDDVAEYLGVSVRHVRRLVFERRIPYVKWGHLLRFDIDDINAWLAERRRDALLIGPNCGHERSPWRGLTHTRPTR